MRITMRFILTDTPGTTGIDSHGMVVANARHPPLGRFGAQDLGLCDGVATEMNLSKGSCERLISKISTSNNLPLADNHGLNPSKKAAASGKEDRRRTVVQRWLEVFMLRLRRLLHRRPWIRLGQQRRNRSVGSSD